MSLSTLRNELRQPSWNWVGVGLRQPHYAQALKGASQLDFIEIHAENFFADGGVTIDLLTQIADRYPVSLHATSLGLGSAAGLSARHLEKLKRLVDQVNPILVSDHASFNRVQLGSHAVHAGDLLPLEYTRQSLVALTENVDRAQQYLGRRILVENVCVYFLNSPAGDAMPQATMTETEFLSALVENTGCELLVDLNNLLVNAHNHLDGDALDAATGWLTQIPPAAVGELHLAGFTPPAAGDIAVDDHAHPVSQQGWELYRRALARLGPTATLIEWDNQLPAWETLLDQVDQARIILQEHYAREAIRN